MDIVQRSPADGVTFFYTKFAKQSLYSFQPIVINFDTTVRSGDYFYATLPTHGTRILHMWLNVPTSNLVSFDVLIDKVMVYSWTGEYIAIHNSLRTPVQKQVPGYILIPLMSYFPVVENTQIRINVSGSYSQQQYSLVADWVYDSLPVDGEYMLNQVQTLPVPGFTGGPIRLPFKNVIKELIVVVQDQSQSPLVFTDQIATMSLTLNDKTKFNDQGSYFKYVQPMMYHTGNRLGVYVYSFSLFPEDEMPSGGLNFGMVNNVTLTINLLNSNPKNVRVYGLSYNVLKLKNFKAQVMYDNT